MYPLCGKAQEIPCLFLRVLRNRGQQRRNASTLLDHRYTKEVQKNVKLPARSRHESPDRIRAHNNK